ncbi:histidine phosphatase family protein [Falsarthrobacter nasiphocae]|uniref:Broad specificity phosphatase PhoE n=1 Tax=Falsarthrobacter nasiphocae TaxID=189863 RepID=A0AAE4C6A6_9MICC|nr:histidine phosphatase family protein [Falsarthrobacter nasiphocae]MDR6892373.1 broad specificity phosphatase PhoE [Falsarthrobacter nasiphocae]
MTHELLTTVHVVRHGEVYNPEGVLYGRLPGYHLSDLGREMAEAAADHFMMLAASGERITHLVSSPLERARETAEPTARALGLPVNIDERLIEAANAFEGLSGMTSRIKSPASWPLLYNPFRPSWGEPYAAQAARMARAIDAAREGAERNAGVRAPGTRVAAVVVSHQLPIWVARRSAERRRLWHDPRSRECSLTSVTSFDFRDGALEGVRYDEPNIELTHGAASIPGA